MRKIDILNKDYEKIGLDVPIYKNQSYRYWFETNTISDESFDLHIQRLYWELIYNYLKYGIKEDDYIYVKEGKTIYDTIATDSDGNSISYAKLFQYSDLKNYKGGTLKQDAENGNFASGVISPFVANNIGVPVVTNGVVSFTATATLGRLYYNYEVKANVSYYFRAYVKADSADVSISFGGSLTGKASHSGSGKFELLSGIYTRTSDLSGPFYFGQDERASGWTEIQVKEAMIIPVDNTFLDGLTVSQISDRLEYFENLQSVGSPVDYDQLLDNRNNFGNVDISADFTVVNDVFGDTPYIKMIDGGVTKNYEISDTIESGKYYTVLTHIVKNQLGVDKFAIAAGSGGWATSVFANEGEIGVRKDYVLADGTNHKAVLVTASSDSNEFIFRQIILEGDHTNIPDELALKWIQEQDFGAFEVKGVFIESVGKQKFNKLDVTEGYILNNADVESVNLTVGYSGFISVVASTSYHINSNVGSGGAGVNYYDKDKNLIGSIVGVYTTFTPPANTYYIRANFTLADIDTVMIRLLTADDTYADFIKANVHINEEFRGFNGIEDDFDFKKWNIHTLVNDDIVFHSGVNVNLVRILRANLPGVIDRDATITSLLFIIEGFTPSVVTGFDDVAHIGKSTDNVSPTYYELIVDKANIPDLATAQSTYSDKIPQYVLQNYLPRDGIKAEFLDVAGTILVSPEATYWQYTFESFINTFEVERLDDVFSGIGGKFPSNYYDDSYFLSIPTVEQVDIWFAEYEAYIDIILVPEVFVITEPIGLGKRYKMLKVGDYIYGHELDFERIGFKVNFGFNYNAYDGYNLMMTFLKDNEAIIEYDWGRGSRFADVKLLHAPKTEKDTLSLIVSKFAFELLNPFYQLVEIDENGEITNTHTQNLELKVEVQVDNIAPLIEMDAEGTENDQEIEFDFTGISVPFNLIIDAEKKTIQFEDGSNAYGYLNFAKDSFFTVPEGVTVNFTLFGMSNAKITCKQWVVD